MEPGSEREYCNPPRGYLPSYYSDCAHYCISLARGLLLSSVVYHYPVPTPLSHLLLIERGPLSWPDFCFSVPASASRVPDTRPFQGGCRSNGTENSAPVGGCTRGWRHWIHTISFQKQPRTTIGNACVWQCVPDSHLQPSLDSIAVYCIGVGFVTTLERAC